MYFGFCAMLEQAHAKTVASPEFARSSFLNQSKWFLLGICIDSAETFAKEQVNGGQGVAERFSVAVWLRAGR